MTTCVHNNLSINISSIDPYDAVYAVKVRQNTVDNRDTGYGSHSSKRPRYGIRCMMVPYIRSYSLRLTP